MKHIFKKTGVPALVILMVCAAVCGCNGGNGTQEAVKQDPAAAPKGSFQRGINDNPNMPQAAKDALLHNGQGGGAPKTP